MADFAAGILDRFRKKVPPEKQQTVIREALQAAAACASGGVRKVGHADR